MSIFIFRRDFRIKDNTAWNEMLNNKEINKIYPIFIFTPEQISMANSYKSDNAVQFMIESLLELNKKVKINFCYGAIDDVLNNIIKNNKIDSIYTNTDYTPYSVKREKLIDKICQQHNIKFNYYHDITLYEPNTIKTSSNNIYQKFTPFYRYCLSQKVRETTSKIISNHIISRPTTKYAINISKLSKFYKENKLIHIHGGRNNAINILHNINNFKSYEKTRNIMHLDTTNLSAYLKFGCVSIREAYHYFVDKLGKKHPLVRQLIWREFYYHLGYGFIERFGKSLKPRYDKIKWGNNSRWFKKWKEGKTGFPIIDACMNQLNNTGFMHNRGRLIVSSFLIKNLMIDWRYGEKYFARKLVDYDVLVNQGNWQWTSGSGADSQPFFRVFNPSLQSERYDKDAIYIKKWLPQLKDVEPKHLHDWEKYHSEYNLKEIKYWEPMVNYSESKKKGIQMYKKFI
jgi:deoxyribodipyrimidine photo-lyase